MKDNKELNVINDEELEDVNAGRMSKEALAATIGGSLAGAALLATAIGVPLSKKVKKDKAAKAAASAPVTPEAPTETVNPTAPGQSQDSSASFHSVEELNRWADLPIDSTLVDNSIWDYEPEE